MGRKGVSKRKPKKSGSVSNERLSVQSLVKEKGATLDRERTTPWTGSNKTKKKRSDMII